MSTGESIDAKPATGSKSWSPPGFLPPELHGTIRDRIEAGTHFRVEGTGPALILIHGVGLDLEMWHDHAEALQDTFAVIRYDMLGHGASAKHLAISDCVRSSRNCRCCSTTSALTVHRLSGFSMGAIVAQAFALERPERVAGLVLLNGVYDRSPDALRAIRERVKQAESEGPQVLIEAALERWFTPSYRSNHADVVDRIRRRLENNDSHGFLAAYRMFAGSDAEFAGRLGGIACPALVVTGEDDPGSTPAMTEAMAAAIPDARSKILPGLRHMAPVEGAAEVSNLIRGFLSGLKFSDGTRT